ncbi:MAG: LysE family transporter, partial [Aquitalea sp.]|nr:LysE family transporter [Aquitalea sp.]
VYASVFATFLPPTPSFGFNCTLVALVFLIETGWYSIVAVLLSSATPRRQYLRHKAWLDRLAGGVMMALGLKLAASASH